MEDVSKVEARKAQAPINGRGAASYVPGRYAVTVAQGIDDGWGGKDYDSAFGTRMRGEGPFAQLIAQRFAKAHQRLGYGRLPALDSSKFAAPRKVTPQGELF